MVLRVNSVRAERKIRRLEGELKKRGLLAVDQIARIGQYHAREIAPRATGRMARFIKIFTIPNGKQIKALNPTGGSAIRDGYRHSIGNYPNFNLVRWAHTSPRARTHFKKSGGDPRFMYTTRRYLNSIKGSITTGGFKNINLR